VTDASASAHLAASVAEARRIRVANDRLGAAQRSAFWPDLAAPGAQARSGVRRTVGSAVAVARELATSRGPIRGEGAPPGRAIPAGVAHHPYEAWAAVRRDGAVPLEPPPPGRADGTPLHIAFAILPFGYGSGGHEVVFRLAEHLEAAGHTVSLWLDDPFGATAGTPASALLRRIDEDFGVRLRAPLHLGFGDWFGADVAVATGWQTVWPLLRLPATHARAYLVNDDEPAFYPRSIESRLAGETYQQDVYCVAGTRWMIDLLRERDGARGGWFDYAVAPAYRPRPVQRRNDTVVLYARTVTHRRAVGLAVMAIEDLVVRRGRALRVLMFGDEYPMPVPFDYEFLGLVRAERLAWAYSEATVGVALSLTNASLVPQDMMACGLPCVELAGGASQATYGDDTGVVFAPFDPVAMADVIERLLDDPAGRDRRRAAGLAFAAERTWARAGAQVETHLRAAVREREPGASRAT
jgi:hypothetical protein